MPLTIYTTIYTTVQNVVTRHIVSRYRIVSDIVTRLDVDYYEEDTDAFVTRISYPTRYVRDVNTVLVDVETVTAEAVGGIPRRGVIPPLRAGATGGTPRRGAIPPLRAGTRLPTVT
jgi:hypothetical protein